MKKLNKDRAGCKDVFKTFLFEGVCFSGKYDLPIIKEEHSIPRKCIKFSDALREKNDFNQWVMFYEDDFLFERIWNNPKRYLHILKNMKELSHQILVCIMICHWLCKYGMYFVVGRLVHGYRIMGFELYRTLDLVHLKHMILCVMEYQNIV